VACGRWFRGRAVVSAALAALGVAACDGDVHLTRAPIFGADAPAATTRVTEIGVAAPIDVEALGSQLRETMSARPVQARRWLRRAGCFGAPRRCFGARVDVTLSTKGAVQLRPRADGTVDVRLPVDYRLEGRGLRVGRSQRDVRTGTVVVSRQFALSLSPNLTPSVRAVSDVRIEGETAAVFETTLDLSRHLRRHKQRLRSGSVAAAVEKSVRAGQLDEAVTRGWAVLQKPLTVPARSDAETVADAGDSAGYWLVAEPIRVGKPGFAATPDGRVAARAVIRAKVLVGDGEAPDVSFAQPLLARFIARSTKDEDAPRDAKPFSTELSFRSEVAVADLSARLADALATQSEFAMRDTPTSPRVVVRLAAPEVRPARRFLALSFDAEVVSPVRYSGMSGRLHLVGRPTVDAGGAMLRLSGLSFPVIGQPDAVRPRIQPPLSAGPLVERFAPAMSIPLPDVQSGALRAAKRLLSVEGVADFDLAGEFDRITVDGALPSTRGVRLATVVGGQLWLIYRPNQQQAVARRNVLSSGLVDEIRALANN
jgi:hypothetical protein